MFFFFTDVNLLREEEINFMEELIKKIFWKDYKNHVVVLLLDKRHYVRAIISEICKSTRII